ncbi:hypothetical protein [Arthrobacter sp.]
MVLLVVAVKAGAAPRTAALVDAIAEQAVALLTAGADVVALVTY